VIERNFSWSLDNRESPKTKRASPETLSAFITLAANAMRDVPREAFLPGELRVPL
jgi:hypothetical protein